jgi:hypothetical protein
MQQQPPVTQMQQQPPVTQMQQQSQSESEPIEGQILDKFFNNDLNLNPPEINSAEYERRQHFINFFTRHDFLNIANNVYQQFPKDLRIKIAYFYRLITASKRKKTTNLYTEMCKQCLFINTSSNNDSFFSAICYGVNMYNYENSSKKIIYNIYGKSQLFTIQILRKIVWKYYSKLGEEERTHLITKAQTYADDMNADFNALTDSRVTDEMYIKKVNRVYNFHKGNFLVYKPTRKPVVINEDNTPFRVLRHAEIEKYITSDYPGDEFAIRSICAILGICVIPIEKYILSGQSQYKTNIEFNEFSKKVLFLYKEGIKYQTIAFNYNNGERNSVRYYTIFNTTNDFLIPFHILLLIYGSNYIYLPDKKKEEFIFPNVLKAIHASVINIVNNDDDANTFITNCNKIFNIHYLRNQINNASIVGGSESNNKLEYSITVDLELYPGTGLTQKQIKESNCNSKYNSIRKAYSEMIGRPYVIQPNSQTKKIGGKTRRKSYNKNI